MIPRVQALEGRLEQLDFRYVAFLHRGRLESHNVRMGLPACHNRTVPSQLQPQEGSLTRLFKRRQS